MTDKNCKHEWQFSRGIGHVCRKCYKIVQENPAPYGEELGNGGEPLPPKISEDDWRVER